MELPPLNTEELADLLESVVLCAESRALGFRDLGLMVCRALKGIQSRIDFAITIMERRQQWLGDSYPFVLTASALMRKPHADRTWYASLLMMSPNTIFRALMTQDTLTQCSTAFERISEVAMVSLLGPNADAVRFGWPSECGRPAEFPDAIAWLAEKMGLRVGAGYRPPRRKDGGVDIIAWRAFEDGRTAFPIMLGQCTVQRDVLSKTLDIDLRNWGQWLLTLRDPTTVVMLPFVLSGNTEDWNEVAQRHIILDRLRITRLVASSSRQPQEILGVEALSADMYERAATEFTAC